MNALNYVYQALLNKFPIGIRLPPLHQDDMQLYTKLRSDYYYT